MRVAWLVAVIAVVGSPPGAAASSGAVRDGPLMRAALASLAADQAKSPPPRPGKSRDDWSPVVALPRGGEIVLTVRGAAPLMPQLLHADEDGLIVLDLRHPGLSKDARNALRHAGADYPHALLAARAGGEQRLPRRLRVSREGVFFDEHRVADLADVVKMVPRSQVVDVSVRRKHVGTHTRRGFLIGAAIGAGAGALVSTTCGEGCPVLGVAAFGAVVGGVYGLEFGAIVGLVAPRSPDVIYHVD